jgi:hypothetical protein
MQVQVAVVAPEQVVQQVAPQEVHAQQQGPEQQQFDS